MIAIRATDLKNDFRGVCAIVTSGTPVIVARPKNKNIVLVSQERYAELEMMEKLALSRQQAAEGKIVTKTLAELEEFE